MEKATTQVRVNCLERSPGRGGKKFTRKKNYLFFLSPIYEDPGTKIHPVSCTFCPAGIPMLLASIASTMYQFKLLGVIAFFRPGRRMYHTGLVDGFSRAIYCVVGSRFQG